MLDQHAQPDEPSPTPDGKETATLRRWKLSTWIGLCSAIASIAFAVISYVLYRLLLSGTIPFVAANVHAVNRLTLISKIAVPTLAVLGAVAVFRGFRQTVAALKREIKETEHGKWFPVVLRNRKPVQVLLALNILTSSYFALEANASVYIFNNNVEHHCQWGTGEPARCTYRITVSPESTVDFNWKGFSQPPGATFKPLSGSISPGETSKEIMIVNPFICPMVFIFRDEEQNLEIRSRFDSPCRR